MEDVIAGAIEQMLLSMDSDINNVVGILNENWFYSNNDWYNFAMGVQTVIRPIALIIVTICFLLEFLKLSIHMDILKWEFALRCFFKLVLAKVCMDVSTYVLSAIYLTVAEWISGIGTSYANLGAVTWGVIRNEITGAGWLELIGLFLTSGITIMAINVIVIVIQVIAYARKFEITLLLAVAPLPCAFLPLEDGGMSRIPVKYFLGFAGTCLAGLFMIMSVSLYGVLANEMATDIAQNGGDVISIIGRILLATLVLVMAVMKSSSWASKVIEV